MRSVVRVIGNMLRLVGISNPEDFAPKACNGIGSAFLERTQTASRKAENSGGPTGR
jgi:hypothetical protein